MAQTLRETILGELATGVRTTNHLLDKAQEVYEEWRTRSLRDGMRTLEELVNHLVQIPSIDLAIMTEAPEEEVHVLEADLRSDTIAGLQKTLNEGFEKYRAHIEAMDDATLLTKQTKAFYAEQPATQAHWLVETLTHFFHHRAQFFTYLKAFGLSVDMFDLY